jgi:hypothetical protein
MNIINAIKNWWANITAVEMCPDCGKYETDVVFGCCAECFLNVTNE